MTETKKKKSILSKEISFGKKNDFSVPKKKGINFIHDNEKRNNIYTLVFFGIFVIVLGLFSYFGAFRLIEKANQAEQEYSTLEREIDQINASMSDYDEVSEEYNDTAAAIMNDDEVASSNRMAILTMINEDIESQIPVMDIKIEGAEVSITTAATNLNTVSAVLSVLQSDSRNAFATVTTTSAEGTADSDQVIADYEITYATVLADESGTKTVTKDNITIYNAPFIADKSTRLFHVRTCSEVAEIDDFNKVPFLSAKDALAEGYVACSTCNPS